MTKEQERDKVVREFEQMASELQLQIEMARTAKQKLNKDESEYDRQFLEGWGFRKDI